MLYTVSLLKLFVDFFLDLISLLYATFNWCRKAHWPIGFVIKKNDEKFEYLRRSVIANTEWFKSSVMKTVFNYCIFDKKKQLDYSFQCYWRNWILVYRRLDSAEEHLLQLKLQRKEKVDSPNQNNKIQDTQIKENKTKVSLSP